MKTFKFGFALQILISFCLPCLAFAGKKPIWIYTSIYKEYTPGLQQAFEKENPEYELQFFQGGSEKIQAKVEAELLAKRPQADIVLTSNPFWGVELKKRGLLDDKFNQSETNYYSLMVIIVHKDLAAAQRPGAFSDLTKPEFKNLVQMGSPLESGTAFSSVAYFSKKYGWDYFKKLRENNLSSSGGNATVIQKVESGEKKIGLVLLENALAAKKKGSPIEIIYPSDGSIPIPSVQIVLKDAKEKEGAEKFGKFILSKKGQEVLREGYMYSVRKDVSAPEGAKPFAEVTKKSISWTPEVIANVAADSKNIKKQYSQIVLQ